jgi:uncharacterized protein (DUF2344 family)
VSFLEAHPGFRQVVNHKVYTIKWMFSKKSDAEKFINKLRKTDVYKEVILYERIKDNKLYGRHPYCVGVRGKK